MTTAERQAILDAMGEQFMKPVVTRRMEWVELDGTHGITALPLADVGKSGSTLRSSTRR